MDVEFIDCKRIGMATGSSENRIQSFPLFSPISYLLGSKRGFIMAVTLLELRGNPESTLGAFVLARLATYFNKFSRL